MQFTSPVVVVTAFASLVSIGCGPKEGQVRVYPVRGTVLVKGQPADGARVVFYPIEAAESAQKLPTPAGTTDASGVYRLGSYESEDGAPAGEFKVTIVWPEPPPANPTGEYSQPDRLGGRFSTPEKTTLTATVEEGGGEIPPFELQ